MRSFSLRDNVDRILCRGDLSFSHSVSQSVNHCVPWGNSDTGQPPSDTTCKGGAQSARNTTGPAMTDHYDALETRDPPSARPTCSRGCRTCCARRWRRRPMPSASRASIPPPSPAGRRWRACRCCANPNCRPCTRPPRRSAASSRRPPARLGGCSPRPARSSSPRPPTPTPGAARGRCSPPASGRATWC